MTNYLSGVQVREHARVAGFNGNDLLVALAVAHAESGWNTDARYVTSEEDSRGLWQINVYAHPWGYGINLYDAHMNAGAAWTVFRDAGYRWTPWTTYTRGTYQQAQHWNPAVQAFNSSGVVQGFGPADSAPPIQGFGPADPINAQVGPWDHGPDVHRTADLFTRTSGDHNRLEAAMHSLII